MGIPEERGKGAESIFKETVAEKFPNMGKKQDTQVHEANQIVNLLKTKRPSLRHIKLKTVKSQ